MAQDAAFGSSRVISGKDHVLKPRADQPAAAVRRVLGLDIGGANIKAATADGQAVSLPFAMWLHPEQLAQRLVELAGGLPACQSWAVTMTGEMADVFVDRGMGVRALVEQTTRAAKCMGIEEVGFYSVDGRFLCDADAVEQPDSLASANWHALASWVASWTESPSLLIDVGSTTTDLLAIEPGRVATASRTDFDRLAAGELVYLGGARTPVCSLVGQLPFQRRQVPVMREVFATSDDCALVLGWTDEDHEDRMTSDGAPRSVAAATNRLARMIGLDHRGVDLQAAQIMARAVFAAAADALATALARHSSRYGDRWILSGHTAEYFLPALLATRSSPAIQRLSDRIGPQLSRVAPAYACAKLYQADRQASCIQPPS